MTDVLIKIEVEILSCELQTGTGIDKRSGDKYQWARQVGYVKMPGKPYPVPLSIRLDVSSEQKPYPVGVYWLDDSSFWIDQYKNLKVTPRLIPVVGKG